ncbi:MAG: cellulase family glycosylhydrolase [Verrucomicrobiota bacterium]|nr:cellulase family glycosylhydrolase [Verrucomicrobiota bacterium]
MNAPRFFLLCLPLALLGGCTTPHTAQTRLERIVVAPDSRGFILAGSKQPFHPWGFNYGNHGRLMEDFWNGDWKTFAGDFRKMKALGANVVRVHLQYGKFMSGPDRPNRAEFKQLSRMLRLAEKTGLYLDVTGLACYRPGDTPEWYKDMDERQHWAAQSNFWNAVAATCARSPAVFCYDLINEPIVSGGRREPGAWSSGHLFGHYDFVQFITLDPAGRRREDIAADWIRVMTAAIRAHDTHALITVGLLPWTPRWGFLSGFVPKKIAPDLDFIAVHIYPDAKKPGEAMEALRKCAVGKPVVIEETFPLSCSAAEEEAFLCDSKKFACGWMGHYDGCSPKDFDTLEREGKLTLSEAIYREWERLFVKLKPEFAPTDASQRH